MLVSTMSYFRKIKDGAAKSVEDTKKIRLHVPPIILQDNSIHVEGDLNERRDSIQEA